MRSNPLLLRSFALSPLVSCPVTMIVFLTCFFAQIPRYGLKILEGAVVSGLAAVVIAYPVLIMLGIPATLTLRKLGWFGPGMMAAAGGSAGAVPFFLEALMGTEPLRKSLPEAWWWAPHPILHLIAGVPSGVFTAYMVWRTAVGRAHMRPVPRLLISFVVSPLVALPVTCGVEVVWFALFHGELPLRPSSILGFAFYVGLIAVPYAYATVLVGGAPTTLGLRRIGLFRPGVMMAAGAFVGGLPLLLSVYSQIQAFRQGIPHGAGNLGLFSGYMVAGMASGLVIAWLIWRFNSSVGAAKGGELNE